MAKRFMRSSDLYASEGPAGPNWTDSEGFYKRVGWLTSESHSASNDDEDIKDYFMCLEQLHLEILGAITKAIDRETIEKVRRQTWVWVYDPRNDNKRLCIKREAVRPYHEILNKMCHHYGLFLKKTLKNSLDSWEEETKKYDNKERDWEKIKVRTLSDDTSGQ